MSLGMTILGVVRNGGAELPSTLQAIEALRARLPESRVIIATNDNTDDTDAVLAAYEGAAAAVTVLRLDGQMADLDERVERITRARNATLEALFATEEPLPLSLVLDLDGPNTALDPTDVLRAAQQSDVPWEGRFANQADAYYDLYALRCSGWCESDVWQEIHAWRKPLLGARKRRAALLSRLIYERQFLIPPDTAPIAVDSAFGGLGLYRTEALRGLHYDARDVAGRLTCEHVNLHRAMRAAGARLYIDPALRNLTQTEHLGPASGAPLPPRLIPPKTKEPNR